MFDAPLLPGLGPLLPERCRARIEPRASPRSPRVIDRMRCVDGRRVLTTTAGLTSAEIAELGRASRFGTIEVRYRIPTPDRRLAAVLDPGAPAPSLRLASLRSARRAGLVGGVVVAPIVPGVNSRELDLRDLFAAARASGAAFVDAEIVIPGTRRREELLRALRRRYPRVAARYEVWLRTANRPPHEERAQIDELLAGLGRRFGLPRDARQAGGTPRPGAQVQFSFAV